MGASNITPPPGFVLENPAPPPGFVLDESWGVNDTLRVAGAVLGGFAAMPVAGMAGYARLLTEGPEEATKTIEEIGTFPSKLLTTKRQHQAAERVGGLIAWPFVEAGKGYAGLAELISTGDLQKATDVVEGRSVGSNISVPIADVGGQVVGMVAMGGVRPSIKARLRSKPVTERPFRSFEDVPPEGFVPEVKAEVKPEVKVQPVEIPEPPKGFVPETATEAVKPPVIETLPEVKVSPPPADIQLPPSVLKDHPELKGAESITLPKPEPEKVQVPDNLLYGQKKKVTPKETVVEPDSVKTVTSNIEIPKAPAKAPKAQKAYLIDALDTAIKEAKETANPTGSVLIEIPGDGQFKIQNNEIMLESFRKTVKSHFPENLPKPKGYKAYPSTKATGKRITSEDVEYYNEFAPRKEAVKQTSNSRWAYSTDGFATDGVYAVKTKKPGDAGLAEDMKVLDIVPAELKPANIIGEFRNQFDNEGNVYAHLVAKTGEDTVIPAKQLDIILTEHPTATAFISEQGKPVVFKVGKEVAGLISPIKGGDPYLQYRGSLSDRTLEIVNQKGIDISKYTANKLEAIRLEIEKTKSRITDIKKNIEEYTTKGRDDLLGYEQSTLETNTAELKELGDLLDKTEGLADGTLLSKDKGPGTSTLFTGVDISRAKEVATSLYNAVKSPPKWTTFMEALGKFGGRIQMGNLEMHRYAQGLKKRVPDKISREAIVNFLQSDGDLPTLLDRYTKTKANPRTKEFAEGYARAGKLTPEDLKVAAEVKEHFNQRLREAIDVDMLDTGVENYVNQMWEKENPVTAKLKGEIATGKLQPNPDFIRKRIFESYFEGEQVGYKPKNKDIGFLLTSYDQAFNKAIASRAFIKSLNEKMATDGRPLTHPSGMGMPVPKERVTEAILVKPRLKPEEFGDYQPLNHPALRKWKWVSKTEDGTPIFLQGDLLVHPEIYRHLKTVLGTSALRQNPIGKAALTTVQSLKGTLLSLSGFHQTHVAQHGLTHKVNPFNAPEINLNDPLTRSLIEHGVSVADHASMDLFSEGMASSGLINKLPGIGPLMQKYTEYLFKGYIPRLKMEMATRAYGRNKTRYGKKLTDDQIQFLTGQQANAAFGELNYDMMGRNKTFQDVMRLVLLAPDFLEARAKFAGQAVTPYGHEQFMAAAVRGALGMYTAARVTNAIFNDGDPKWDKYFNVVIGGKEYSIRSVQGDVQHLFTDPRSFVYHRMNPTTVRTAIEYFTSRDEMGRYRDLTDQAGDFIRSHIPIPLQGAMKTSDRPIWQSMLQSVGVTSYEARTAFDKAVQEEKGKKYVSTPLKSERDRMKLVSQYGREYKEAIKSNAPKGDIASRLKKDFREGKLYEEDLETIHSMATTARTLHNIKQLSVEDIIPIWSKTTAEEKKLYQEVFLQKIENLSDKHPERYKKLLPELRKLFRR